MAFKASWEQTQLAKRLEQLRTSSGLTAEEAAERAGFSRQKLNRIESAIVRVSPDDVFRLCIVYAVGAQETEQLREMAAHGRASCWWDEYERFLSPSYEGYIRYEDDARVAVNVQPVLIPGLLQTPEYAAGLYAGSVMIPDPDQADILVRVRMRRQRRITEPEQPLQLDAVIGEAALRKPYGGVDNFRTQLRHLLEVQEQPSANVRIRVVPLDRPVVFWPLEVFEFLSGGPAVVFHETLWGYTLHDTDTEIRQARRVCERITQDALSQSESAAFIERLIREMA